MMRYLLDTVTISEFRRGKRRLHPAVELWQRDVGDVWLSVITLNEIRYGMRMVMCKDAAFAAILADWYAQIIGHVHQPDHIGSGCAPLGFEIRTFRQAQGRAPGTSGNGRCR